MECVNEFLQGYRENSKVPVYVLQSNPSRGVLEEPSYVPSPWLLGGFPNCNSNPWWAALVAARDHGLLFLSFFAWICIY